MVDTSKLDEPDQERCIVFPPIHLDILNLSQSSLTLALLRCIFTEGDIYYDGIKISDVNLDVLRSKITIIPQVVSTLTPAFVISVLTPDLSLSCLVDL